MVNNKTYMLLGGNGTLGVQFARHLLLNSSDVNVICVGRSPEKHPAFSLQYGIDDLRYAYHQIDIAKEPQRLLELLKSAEPSFVVNFAAQSESSASWKSSWLYFETNDVALAKIVEPLIGVPWLERWIQIGSSEVYGATSQPATEEFPLVPATPYSASKAGADLYLLSLARVYDFPVTIARLLVFMDRDKACTELFPKLFFVHLLDRSFPWREVELPKNIFFILKIFHEQFV